MKKTVIHILGSGHCGSTILDILLDGQKNISGFGEVNTVFTPEFVLGTSLCSCGKTNAECAFWSGIRQAKFAANVDACPRSFQKSSLFEWIGKSVVTTKYQSELVSLNEKLYSVLFAQSKSTVIIDSSKDSYRAKYLAEHTDFNHVFVHLVRDGRGVYWSYHRKYGQNTQAILFWIYSNLKAEIILLFSRVPKLRISYEKLVANPEMELRRILRAGGLDPVKLNSNLSNDGHLIGGNRLRLTKVSTLVDKQDWRKKLSFWQKTLFFFVGGWLNFLYGYRKL